MTKYIYSGGKLIRILRNVDISIVTFRWSPKSSFMYKTTSEMWTLYLIDQDTLTCPNGLHNI